MWTDTECVIREAEGVGADYGRQRALMERMDCGVGGMVLSSAERSVLVRAGYWDASVKSGLGGGALTLSRAVLRDSGNAFIAALRSRFWDRAAMRP